ncbi:MAG: GNAT family N-acetyltransferase, partial [Myxococcales bacterium]|nr:GNAT family N-acetyltransferase [Myxococcales bacterium]
MPIDVSDFETRIRERRLVAEDYDEYRKLLVACFPGLKPWKREQFESMLKHFPPGQICIEVDGEIVASSCSLIVRYDDYTDWHDYMEISGGGYIENHDPEGDTLYGIEMMVHPEYRGRKLARRLYDARKQICREHNLARMIIGGRIPGYGKYADELSPREYVEKVVSRGLYDPVLTTQVANGFVLKKLIPNYFPSDTASRGYATHLEWTNLDYVEETAQRRMQSVAFARICAVQYQMRHLDTFEDFCAQCEYFLDTASDSKADFVLFPELVTTQLLAVSEKKRRPSDAARKLAEHTSAYLEFFTRMSIKYNINIIGGSQFTVEDDHLYNIAYLFRRDGTIEKQYKLHVTPDEWRWWGVVGGDTVEVFDTDCGRVAILICYD